MSSLRFLWHLIQHTPWQFFAALAAAPALIAGLAFIFYPDVYSLSKSYNALASNHVPPKLLGAAGVFCSGWVFAMLDRPRLRYGVFGLMLFLATIMFSSLLSVGFSSGTCIYILFFSAAAWAFIDSGGFRAGRN